MKEWGHIFSFRRKMRFSLSSAVKMRLRAERLLLADCIDYFFTTYWHATCNMPPTLSHELNR